MRVMREGFINTDYRLLFTDDKLSVNSFLLFPAARLEHGYRAEHGETQRALDVLRRAEDVGLQIFEQEDDDAAEQEAQNAARQSVDGGFGTVE